MSMLIFVINTSESFQLGTGPWLILKVAVPYTVERNIFILQVVSLACSDSTCILFFITVRYNYLSDKYLSQFLDVELWKGRDNGFCLWLCPQQVVCLACNQRLATTCQNSISSLLLEQSQRNYVYIDCMTLIYLTKTLLLSSFD